MMERKKPFKCARHPRRRAGWFSKIPNSLSHHMGKGGKESSSNSWPTHPLPMKIPNFWHTKSLPTRSNQRYTEWPIQPHRFVNQFSEKMVCMTHMVCMGELPWTQLALSSSLSLPSLKSCTDSHVYYYHTTYIGKWLGMVSQCCKPVLVGRGNGWERVKVGKIHSVKKRSRRTVPAMPFYPILKLPHRWIGKVAFRVPNTIFTSEFAEFTPRADWIISRYVMLWMFMASYLPMP